jgi:hypothetical protein
MPIQFLTTREGIYVAWLTPGSIGESKTAILSEKTIPAPMAIADFPNLVPQSFEVTSNRSPFYNCIAWAANDTENWWWPDIKDSYWPPGVPRVETLDAFEAAYGTLGYKRCDDGTLEDGFEKIAIYENADGPQHAAPQLSDGRWTSKLGPDEDIAHNTLDGVAGQLYGQPVRYLRRPRRSKP